jgi:hypothetical protein
MYNSSSSMNTVRWHGHFTFLWHFVARTTLFSLSLFFSLSLSLSLLLGIKGGRWCPKGDTDRARERQKRREEGREKEREGVKRERERERERKRERWAGGRKTHSRRPFIFGDRRRLFLAPFHRLQFFKLLTLKLNNKYIFLLKTCWQILRVESSWNHPILITCLLSRVMGQ